MATFAKQALSASTNGKQIKVTATTNGTANTIHTAVSGTASFDEVWLYAYNESTAAVLLTILFGGVSEPDNVIRALIPPQAGRTLVCDGMILQNSLIIKAYAGSANLIMIDGFVNNIS